jgi:urease accessory protein
MTAELMIRAEMKSGITRLKSVYQSQPFKVADVTEDRTRNLLRLMLMTASPGILDGDDYRQKIELADNAVLELETQAYQRLFTMKKGACQHFRVELGRHASFYYLPHPVVPHAGSIFAARNQLFLSAGSSLAWGEVLTCGRKLNGEVFQFSKYHTITEVFYCGKLVTRENLLIEPGSTNMHGIGQMEGYTHQASFIYINENLAVKDCMRRLTDLLIAEDGIEFGITTAPVNGLIVRLFGFRAEQLHGCLKRIAAVCAGVA